MSRNKQVKEALRVAQRVLASHEDQVEKARIIRDRLVMQARRRGMSPSEIAEAMNLTTQEVYPILRRAAQEQALTSRLVSGRNRPWDRQDQGGEVE